MSRLKKVLCSVGAIVALITGGVTVNDAEYTRAIGQVQIAGESVGELRISTRALDIIGNAEGCRRDPYRCPAGLMTNGIGNTHGVINGNVSDEQIAKDWIKNIQEAERCLFEWKDDTAFTQGHIDALTSFVFNTGCSRFRYNANGTETQIGKFVRLGHYELACHQLNRWVKSGGVILPGLVTRRQEETDVCLSP